MAATTKYTAYLDPEHAAWFVSHPDLVADGLTVTDEGDGIVTFGSDVLQFLQELTGGDDGCISGVDGHTTMFIAGLEYPVVADNGDPAEVLARTMAALPDMAPLTQVVAARRLMNTTNIDPQAVRQITETVDAAIADLDTVLGSFDQGSDHAAPASRG